MWQFCDQKGRINALLSNYSAVRLNTAHIPNTNYGSADSVILALL